jgi:hypothetical protein
MAVRGRRTEVIKALIEMGAEVPTGMATGLTDQEMLIARWRGRHYEASTGKPEQTDDEHPVFEEIEMVRCYGTDTSVLDADLIRAARDMDNKLMAGTALQLRQQQQRLQPVRHKHKTIA